jgi:phenylalanyl-tRNA synthetase beta chain
MRFSEAWLRTYVNPALTTQELVHQITMAGLEVDSAIPAAGEFSGVVVGEILEAAPHPEADRLKVCRVAAGLAEPLQIVCGAPNARVGLRAPLALEGALLPGGLKIKASKLRGIPSFGMLCSAKELGIDDDASGLMELSEDVPAGTDIRQCLQLDDSLIEVDLTPNRADCLSVEGIAREVALLNGLSMTLPTSQALSIGHDDSLPVNIDAPEACPRYLGRLIKGVNRDAPTPLWMKERLRRSGIRSLDVIVDITNYVLLELGQPLHAFDAAKLEGGIRVRHARDGEKLRLLNDQELMLHPDTLVIADEAKALALAGIMGGSDSAVSETTQDIFLECAFFTPQLMMGEARRYGLSTDSSHRFERGVSFELQDRALARASELLVSLARGKPGPIVEAISQAHLPQRLPVLLRAERIQRLLGIEIDAERVAWILRGLGMNPETHPEGWQVVPPAFRFDIAIESDLIEEVGRVYGYDHLPRKQPTIPAAMRPVSESVLELSRVKHLLVDRGYQEAITYSFVGYGLQKLIDPDIEPLALKNPISAELAVMRTSLWPGLLDAAIKNNNRQQNRVRLFESGLRFITKSDGLDQRKSLAWLATGPVNEEQWAEKQRAIDFYDIKADIEALLLLTGRIDRLSFIAVPHPALHPGQSAEIILGSERAGWVGMLHPQLEKQLGFDQRVFLVELDQSTLLGRDVPRFSSLSRFPTVRRDIAVIVDDAIPVAQLTALAKEKGGVLLREVMVFDVYQGPGVEAGKKSVALGLVWQDELETLVDARVEEALNHVLDSLRHRFEARLRD